MLRTKTIREREGVKLPTRHYSKQQEKIIAKALGARVTPNSGATPFIKGDVLTDRFLIEAKTCTTDKNSFSIKKEWIEKNRQEMCFMGKDYSAIAFSFGPSSKQYYVIDEELMLDLIKLHNNRKD